VSFVRFRAPTDGGYCSNAGFTVNGPFGVGNNTSAGLTAFEQHRYLKH
jgi:hypothetical protein